MSSRARARGLSPRTLAYAGLLLGGGLGVVAAAQPWWRAVGADLSVEITGVEATGGLSQALAVVTLVGALLILVLKTRGRRVVGVLLTLAGLGIVLLGVLRIRPSSDAVLTQVREVSLADQFALEATSWSWVFALAGALVCAGAVLTTVTAGRWPTRADRFERTDLPVRPVAADDEPVDVWRALDAGLDPTSDRPADDPNVRNIASRATMGTTHEYRPTPDSPQSSPSAE